METSFSVCFLLNFWCCKHCWVLQGLKQSDHKGRFHLSHEFRRPCLPAAWIGLHCLEHFQKSRGRMIYCLFCATQSHQGLWQGQDWLGWRAKPRGILELIALLKRISCLVGCLEWSCCGSYSSEPWSSSSISMKWCKTSLCFVNAGSTCQRKKNALRQKKVNNNQKGRLTILGLNLKARKFAACT